MLIGLMRQDHTAYLAHYWCARYKNLARVWCAKSLSIWKAKLNHGWTLGFPGKALN